MDVPFKNISAEMPIIGFTGALGSGCTFLANLLSIHLSIHYSYGYYSLSKPIHDTAKKEGLEETSKNLQDIGNRLRKENGADYLVEVILQEAEKEMPPPEEKKRPQGLIIDGIRNAGEVEALRQWPHFYLISVQAEQETRKRRLMKDGKYSSESDFFEADKRDSLEPAIYGQQVKRCNYLADIIISNNENFASGAEQTQRQYITDKLYNPYISLIECLADGKIPFEHRPTQAEAMMTAAYVESKLSSCLKRKVGAIITSKNGELLATGHNDIPEGAKPCFEDPEYEWCARDVIQEKFGQKMFHCPRCGTKIKIKTTCFWCDQEINKFLKKCPKCKWDPELEYNCPECKTNIFREYLPGFAPETGKLLDMCRALHAEDMALLNLSKNGILSSSGMILYTTTFPCNLCANKLVTAGINKVLYAEPYITKEAIKIFIGRGVKLNCFEGVKSSAYFRLYN